MCLQTKSKYIMAHFTKESLTDGEQVYFALSSDGLHWQDLNGSKAILKSAIGEKGVRDPFILHSAINGFWYIIATDLRIASGISWADAVKNGSHDMIMWKSADLIEWSEPWTHTVELDNIGCVWAPEATFDEKRKEYVVYWASKTYFSSPEKTDKHIIYSSRTADFVHFSAPEIFIEKESDVIDTTIAFDKGVYYRFSKDESGGKNIQIDYASDLKGTFTKLKSVSLDKIAFVEGPAVYRLPSGAWCLLVDFFMAKTGYAPLVCDDLSSGEWRLLDKSEYDMGNSIKRHGSVCEISESDYNRLLANFG